MIFNKRFWNFKQEYLKISIYFMNLPLILPLRSSTREHFVEIRWFHYTALNLSINQQYNLRPLQSETAASRAEIAGSSSSRRTNPEKISARWQSQTATPDVRAFRKMVWQTNTWTRQENNMFKTVMREWAVYVLFKRSKNILY